MLSLRRRPRFARRPRRQRLVLPLLLSLAATSAAGLLAPRVARAEEAAAPTRHPIVLVHGMEPTSAFSDKSYFAGVAARLRGLGAEVLEVRLTGVQTIEHRAAELADQLARAYPDSSVKLNLIAHSAGGLDARYLITHLGWADRVASLTTIATPHRGSSVADTAVGLLPVYVQQSIDTLMNQIGWDWNQITDLTTDHMQRTFNPRTPDAPGVHYQSWAGVVWPRGGLPFVLAPSWGLVLWLEGANDGVVSVASARWGELRGIVPADHMAQVGRRRTGFDHLAFFERIVRDLGRRGF